MKRGVTTSVKKRYVIIAAAAAVAVIAVCVWLNRGRIGFLFNRIVDPASLPAMDVEVSRAEFPVKGIDVSHHNGKIDFRKVAADTVEFVLIKATEGVGLVDSCMARNYDGAVEAGLKVGFYHFFRFDRGGVRQGRHFMYATEGRPTSLPMVIDVETGGNPDVDYYMVVGRLRDMINFLKRHGQRVMIYCNGNTYDKYVRGNFDDADLWLASEHTPGAKGDRRELWQHSHAGKVKGIATPVDINTFNGSRNEFLKWLENDSVPIQ